MADLSQPRKKGKRRITYRQTSLIFAYACLAYPLILFLIFYVYVNFNSIIMAFQDISDTGVRSFAGFHNFSDFIGALFDSGTGNTATLAYSFRNSFIIYGVSLVICMPLYILFSYMLYKKCPGHKAIRAISLLPQIISGFVISLLFSNFIDYDGPFASLCVALGWNKDATGQGQWIPLLTDSRYALWTTIFYSIWLSFATNLIVYPNAMNDISPDIIDSAKVDGVDNMFTDLRTIILPLIWPTLTTFLVTGVASILSNSGPILEFYYLSAPPYVQNMGYYYTVQVLQAGGSMVAYPRLAAGGLLMTLLIAPLTILVRYLLEHFGPSTDASDSSLFHRSRRVSK
jgi:multiple sugar transport system permease protein